MIMRGVVGWGNCFQSGNSSVHFRNLIGALGYLQALGSLLGSLLDRSFGQSSELLLDRFRQSEKLPISHFRYIKNLVRGNLYFCKLLVLVLYRDFVPSIFPCFQSLFHPYSLVTSFLFSRYFIPVQSLLHSSFL